MLCGSIPSSPLRVLGLLLSAVLLLAQAPPAGNKELHEIDRYIQGEIKLNQVPGLSMAVVRGRVVLVTRAYGVRSLATGEPMTVDTPMELASLSKPFTALAVLQLAKRGWLDLDRPVRLYLPEFCPRENEPCAQITARHLLRHTSGFRRRDNFLVPCCGQPGEYDLSLAVRKLRAVTLIGRPGSFFWYANSNYVLLAALVERLSGQAFPDYMRTRVFLPLGMTRTTLAYAQARTWGLAAAHERQWGHMRPSPSRFFGSYGASLVKSTAGDMARFLAAILSGAVDGFGPATSLTPPYDLGWFVTPRADWLNGSLVLAHAGDVWGGNTAAMIAPERELGVVVLVNAGVGRAEQIARGVLARTAGLRGADPGVASQVNDPDFWAICFTVLSALVLLGVAIRAARIRGEFRRGERRFVRSSDGWILARGIVLLAMGFGLLFLAAGVGGPPPASLPTTMKLALPLLAGSFAVVLTMAAVLSFAPRR